MTAVILVIFATKKFFFPTLSIAKQRPRFFHFHIIYLLSAHLFLLFYLLLGGMIEGTARARRTRSLGLPLSIIVFVGGILLGMYLLTTVSLIQVTSNSFTDTIPINHFIEESKGVRKVTEEPLRRPERGASSHRPPTTTSIIADSATMKQTIQPPMNTSITIHSEKSNVKDSCPIIDEKYKQIPLSPLFPFDKLKAEAILQQQGAAALWRPITAYIEPPLGDTVPGTGNRGDLEPKSKDKGTPPDFVIPLPLRRHTPADLQMYTYPAVRTCHDLPGKFPVDRGLEYDEMGNPIVWNVGNDPMPDDFPQQEAPFCPVEADPFLPWIHDYFPSQDGTRIEFIAQNKRRCRTGKNFDAEVNRLVPQITLMQPISVQRLSDQEAQEKAPELWNPGDDSQNTPRYRLAPHEESDPDGQYSRFICRFHATDWNNPSQTKIIGETLSAYPFNYEFAAYRKGSTDVILLTPGGKDTTLFWTSNFRFHCPVPVELQPAVAKGLTVLSDGSPSLYVDVVPIRTSVRYNEIYMTENLIGPRDQWELPGFDPYTRWGEKNVLPRVEASGRWANLPICSPPVLTDECTEKDNKNKRSMEVLVPQVEKMPEKPHVLSACLWASAEFKTRGKSKGASTDTQDRLQEWIEFHLMVGFDHIYVFDNSGAHTNETSLAPVLEPYGNKVSRIDWPSIVCNNNVPAHDSCGERSSQYAAENACRTRYAPFTKWIASFDTDEYLVPMGNYTSLKDVLKDAETMGTNILSFRSSRGRLRTDKSEEVNNDAREKMPNATFLEAYNCDSAGSPKPSWGDRARKQVYRSDYVPYHFVHYSTVTKGLLETYEDVQEKGISNWRRKYSERSPSERVTDEIDEAVMVHTKTLGADMTGGYKQRCRHDHQKKWQACWVAYPYPDDANAKAYDEQGMEFNCQINKRVDQFWVPRLREAMAKRKQG
jgi:hypothetical protein